VLREQPAQKERHVVEQLLQDSLGELKIHSAATVRTRRAWVEFRVSDPHRTGRADARRPTSHAPTYKADVLRVSLGLLTHLPQSLGRFVAVEHDSRGCDGPAAEHGHADEPVGFPAVTVAATATAPPLELVRAERQLLGSWLPYLSLMSLACQTLGSPAIVGEHMVPRVVVATQAAGEGKLVFALLAPLPRVADDYCLPAPGASEPQRRSAQSCW